MADLGLGLSTLGGIVSSILLYNITLRYSSFDPPSSGRTVRMDSLTTSANPSSTSPPDDSSTDSVPVSVVTVPVTVTQTVTLTSSSTTSSTTTSTTTSHSTSVFNSTTTSSTTTTTSSLTGSDLITTTFLTSQGTSLIEITAVVTNPAGHVHNDQSTSTGAFFNNRTAVIGVFTVVGIVAFAVTAALIAWMTRRRTLKRRRQESVDKNSRDFFEDEVNDAGDPSEKSWWGNASGASIPEGGGVPLQPVTSMGYGSVPPVPPLPSEFSHNSANAPSVASKSPLLSDGGLSFPHPYAGTGSSLISDNYSNNTITHDRSGSATTGWTSSTREPAQSPPTSPLPALPYRGPAANNGVYLPLIHEGTPNSLSPSVPNHPFASPPTNRKSELFPEEVLWGFGSEGGIGRSLSGKRPTEPPVPVRQPETISTLPIPPPNQPRIPPAQHPAILQQPQYLFHPADASRGKLSPVESSRLTPEHNIADNVSNSRIRPTSGISEGGWYDDSNSEIGRAALGATASGESFLNSSHGRNDRYGYPYTTAHNNNRSQSQVDKSAATSAAELPEKKSTIPHDPRFSGLFGNVTVAQPRGDSRQSYDRPSRDLDEEEDEEDEEEHFTTHSHGSGNRVLRVTNE